MFFSFSDTPSPLPQLVSRLTVRLLETYKRCNGAYAYARHLNPRRQLSKGAGVGVANDGWDNESADLVIFVNDVLASGAGRRYVVKDLLGQGTFGQVVKCVREDTGEAVAVKVIKNQPAYYHQAREAEGEGFRLCGIWDDGFWWVSRLGGKAGGAGRKGLPPASSPYLCSRRLNDRPALLGPSSPFCVPF